MKKRKGIANAKQICFFLVGALILVALGLAGVLYFVASVFPLGEIYETTDVADYGKYIPNRYSGRMTENINEVMPPKIEEFFKVQKYSYRMCHLPSAQEVYLEVVIEDEETYQTYVSELKMENQVRYFYYDASFLEIVLTQDLVAITISEDGSPLAGYTVVQKIMFCDKTNTIIFVSLDIPWDDSVYLSPSKLYYFERFGIDVSSGKYHSTQ